VAYSNSYSQKECEQDNGEIVQELLDADSGEYEEDKERT